MSSASSSANSSQLPAGAADVAWPTSDGVGLSTHSVSKIFCASGSATMRASIGRMQTPVSSAVGVSAVVHEDDPAEMVGTLLLGAHQLGAAPGPPPDVAEHPDRRQ